MVKKILISNNIRSLRAQTKNLSLELLEDIYQKLNQIIQERYEHNKLALENVIKYDKKLETYLQQLKQDGIELNDLLKKADFPSFRKIHRVRPTRPPKYKYFDDSGNFRTWTGQGRMPKPIRIAINSGKNKSLDDFLIEFSNK